MNNLIILYNPYYQSDVIEQHLKILFDKEKVAFGKVYSKIRKSKHAFEDKLEDIYSKTDSSNYLQLFLTDYSNMFVAKVEKVTTENMSAIAPKYYFEKNLEVEQWYVVSDIKELVRNDFESIRDNYLANLTTPNFGDHTYAVYGNSYIYPLIVDMKQKVNHFEDSTIKHYPNVYKSDEYLNIKNSLVQFSFGKRYSNQMHPNSMDNIISAEIEYQANKQNPLYDFTSVIIKYSKTIEQEIYLFFKSLVDFLSEENPSILDINFSVQNFNYTLNDIFNFKPNLGSYKYLLGQTIIQNEITSMCNKQTQFYILKTIPYHINIVQEIRNETVHGNPPKINDVKQLRNKMLGIGYESMVIELVKKRNGRLNR